MATFLKIWSSTAGPASFQPENTTTEEPSLIADSGSPPIDESLPPLLPRKNLKAIVRIAKQTPRTAQTNFWGV
jgi:hypothetical protein